MDNVVRSREIDVTMRGIGNFLVNLRRNQSLRDFTIKCGSHTWSVHRLILDAHSPVLKAMVNEGFLESRTGELDLSEYEFKHVDALVEYFYRFQYTPQASSEEGESVFHIQMAIIADKYDLQPLRTVAIERFRASQAVPDDRFNLAHFINAAKLVYTDAGTPVPIRELIVNQIAMTERCSTNEKTGKIISLLTEFPDLTLEVAKACCPKLKVEYVCPNAACRQVFKARPLQGRMFVRCLACNEHYSMAEWNRVRKEFEEEEANIEQSGGSNQS